MAPRKIPRFLKRVGIPHIFESKTARAAIGSAPPPSAITVNFYLLSMANGHFRPHGLFLRMEVGKYGVGESPVLRGMRIRLLCQGVTLVGMRRQCFAPEGPGTR